MEHQASGNGAGGNVAQELARLTDRPIEEAEAAYRHHLALLARNARVTTFLSILAQRFARDDLKKPRWGARSSGVTPRGRKPSPSTCSTLTRRWVGRSGTQPSSRAMASRVPQSGRNSGSGQSFLYR